MNASVLIPSIRPSIRPRGNVRFFRRLSLLLAGLSLAAAASTSAFAQRRDFNGSYKVTNVSDQGSEVELTLVLKLHNSSGKEIKNGGIVLYDAEPRPSAVGAFDVIQLLPRDASVTVSQNFAISKSEYAHWQWGVNPQLDFLIPDGKGGTIFERIDLSRETASAKTAE
jgi:hypothetical protein